MFNLNFLTMKTPFTTKQFLDVFAKYNSEVFPAQILLLLSGIAAVLILYSEIRRKSTIVAAILAFLWLWNGIVYQIMFFSKINPAAIGFGMLMSIEAVLILYESMLKRRLEFSTKYGPGRIAGYVFILYGLLIYPVADLIAGHNLTGIISLGLPCPTTIMTFGFFLLAGRQLRRYLLIIPTLWALMGLSAALNFGIYQDFVMVLAALTAILLPVAFNMRNAYAHVKIQEDVK